MAIIRTAVSISVFNILCCIAFIIFKILLFYDFVELNKKQYEVFWIFSYRPRAFYEFGYMMVFETTGYFFAILANSMLILCINTAKYKNSFFFFRIYYIATIWLIVATMIQAVQLELFVYGLFSGLNIFFLYVVATIEVRIRKQKFENCQFDVVY